MKKILLLLLFVMLLSRGAWSQYNTAAGTGALGSVTTGGANTATGYLALGNLTTGWNNSADGAYSQLGNTLGNSNSSYGAKSMYWLYDGSENTAHGYYSLFNVFRGNQNTASGHEALYTADGDKNTAFGYRSLYSTTYGTLNTGVGTDAGWTNTYGNYNTYIGSGADNGSTSAAETHYNNTTVIGYNAHKQLSDTSNKITVGYNATRIGGCQNWTNSSDKRIKRDVTNNVPGLAFIKLLRPVTYLINVSAYYTPIAHLDSSGNSLDIKSKDQSNTDNSVHTGFIAQEVDAAAKSIKYDFSGVMAPKDTNGLYNICYEQFVVPLVKASQEIEVHNNELKEKISNLKQQLALLQQGIDVAKTRQVN